MKLKFLDHFAWDQNTRNSSHSIGLKGTDSEISKVGPDEAFQYAVWTGRIYVQVVHHFFFKEVNIYGVPEWFCQLSV